MIAILVFAFLLALALALVLARYGVHPSVLRQRQAERSGGAARPRMSPERFRALATELLAAMEVVVVDAEPDAAARRLVAMRHEPLHDARFVIFLEPDPPGDVVDASVVLELAESVKSERAAMGLLLTPFGVERAADPDAPMEILDGARLRQLVAEHLPGRLAEIDRYRGFGGGAVGRSSELRQQPV